MHQIVEIASQGVALHKDLGHLVVSKSSTQSRVPLDDIAALIISGGVQLTNSVLQALTDRGALVVLTDDRYQPSALMMPYFQHHRTVDILNLQVRAPKPLQKRMWARIVKEKILNQRALLLELSGPDHVCDRLQHLASTVRSGDPDNKEAQAAILYWPTLFGHGFNRDRELPGLNGFLNYTYAILRASTARAIVAVGLHPALGLFHRNRKNAFCLVDDLMEPFRIVADGWVRRICDGLPREAELTPQIKRELVKVLYQDQITLRGQTPVFQCLRDLALSVCSSYEAKAERLAFPQWCLP